jgi:tetratricopeptide (TPR) repeat protein
VTEGIVDHGIAVPSWLSSNGANSGFSAGAARALNLALAAVLAAGGVWLLAGVRDASDGSPPPTTLAVAPAIRPESPPEADKSPLTAESRDAPPPETPPPSPPDPPDDPEATQGSTTSRAGAATSDDPKTPASAASLVERAKQAMKKGKRTQARQLFEDAIARDPNNHKAMIGLSDLSFDAGNYPTAEKWARHAVEVAPRNADYRIHLGDAHFKLGQTARARSDYEQAAKLGSPVAKGRLAQLPK